MKQLHLNLSGKELKEKGVLKAVQHADQVHGNWSEQAFHIFKIFINQTIKPFRMEQFREYAKGFLVDPPNLRAFGYLTIRAKREGLIKHAGYTQVENAKAHSANCSLWQRV